jgi:hypothetical protein
MTVKGADDQPCHSNGRGPKLGEGKPDFILLRRHPATLWGIERTEVHVMFS